MAALWRWIKQSWDLSGWKANQGALSFNIDVEPPFNLQRVILTLDWGCSYLLDTPDTSAAVRFIVPYVRLIFGYAYGADHENLIDRLVGCPLQAWQWLAVNLEGSASAQSPPIHFDANVRKATLPGVDFPISVGGTVDIVLDVQPSPTQIPWDTAHGWLNLSVLTSTVPSS